MDICVSVKVTGRVQGVWFRQSTKTCADQHRVKGWCRNNADGSVEAVFSGEESAVNNVVEWCKTGPAQARADSHQVQTLSASETFDDFHIR